MLMKIACVGAASRVTAGPFGACSCLRSLLSPAQRAATCVHCKGFFDGCTGSDACPLGKELTDNFKAMEAPSVTKIPSVGVSLPAEMLTVFTKNVVETIVGIACSPEVGKIIDFSDGAFRSATSVVRAAFI